MYLLRYHLESFFRRETNPAPDGSFTLTKVFAGGYKLWVSGLPPGYCVKSARMGDTDALKNGLDFSAGALGPLDIVISPDGGQIEGFVTGPRQQLAAGATVVLVPVVDERARPYHLKKAETDQSGRFRINGVAPGAYKLFAWDWIEGAYQDAEWLYADGEFSKPYDNQGQAITIREGGRESVQLKLIHYVTRISQAREP